MSDRLYRRFKKVYSTYVSTKLVFAMDLFISVCSSMLMLLFVSFFNVGSGIGKMYALLVFGFSLAGTVAGLLVTSSYKQIIRYLSMADMLKHFYMTFVKISVMLVLYFWVKGVTIVITGISLLPLVMGDFLLTFVLLMAVRGVLIFVYSFVRHRIQDESNVQNVVIFGTDERSVASYKRFEFSKEYRVVAFIVSRHLSSYTIDKVPVLGVESEVQFCKLKDRLNFKAVLFVSDKDLRLEREGIVHYASANSVKILIVPSVSPSVKGIDRGSKLRQINIEDLLGRDEIMLSMDRIREFICGKTVLVTGAAGSIGSQLCRILSSFKVKRLVLFDNAETPLHNIRLELEENYPDVEICPVIGDVRNRERIDFVMRNNSPTVVFHAAAYKHVPMMEENPCEAIDVNSLGTSVVADKCVEYNVERMVMISTDKAVNPTNVMGCSKRIAEIYVQSLAQAIASGSVKGITKFVTTRFGNVLGSSGSVIPRFTEQIHKGGPVTVTHPDINRFFMTIPEACRLVMEAATMSKGGEIFVFDMGEPVKIDTLARKMIELSGYKPDVDIKIKYTGLRPGEKLYEEVLANTETTAPTSHGRIRIAASREFDYISAKDMTDNLERFVSDGNISDLVRSMKEYVPEYISANSQFCKFDQKR